MENKKDLLVKLGFSDNYLRILDENSTGYEFQKIEASFQYTEKEIVDNKIISLIIEKTEKPINNHFIFNEK